MDWIRIEALRVDGHFGVHAWEHGWRRPLLLDIELGLDLRPAAASDRLADTVDYDAVARRAAALATECHYELIEHYAEALAQALLEDFAVESLRLRVAKPGAVAAARTVSVQIERRRGDYPAAAR